MSKILNKHKILLDMNGICKRYPGVQALDNVNFKLHKSEVHVLIGQNGAGKSTLMKILAGVIKMDEGMIKINNSKVSIRNPHDAQKHGISMVFQELSQVPDLNVAQNIFLGHEKTKKFGFIDEKKLYESSSEILKYLKIDIGSHIKIRTLTPAQRQLTEIAKVFSLNTKIFILDEPTSSLNNEETENLFKVLNNIKKNNVGIIFISHHLQDIFKCGDRVTILRNGKNINTLDIKETCESEIVDYMIGQKLSSYYTKSKRDFIHPKIVLRASNINVPDKLNNVNLQLYRGEILGITGLVGSGHDLIARCIFGDIKYTGTTYIDGKKVKITSPKIAMKYGIGLITEDRKIEGLFYDRSVIENLTIASMYKYVLPYLKWILSKKENKLCRIYSKKVNLVAPSFNIIISKLSGGNQQKTIVARWLMREPKILFVIDPTRGIDVGAKSEIYSLFNKMAVNGKSIVLISSDLEEIIGMSDRILIFHKGKIIAKEINEGLIEEKILKIVASGRGYQ